MIRKTHYAKGVAVIGVLLAAMLLVNCGSSSSSSRPVTDTDTPGASDTDTIQLVGMLAFPSGKSLTSWDISWVEAANHAFYLADRTNFSVDTFDINTFGTSGNVVTVITPPAPNNFQGAVADPNVPGPNDVSGPNGVVIVNGTEAWAPDAPSFSGPIVKSATPSVAYATDNCNSSVKVINLASQQVTHNILLNGCFRSDELAFDPTDQVVVVANPAEQDIGKPGNPTAPFISLISTKTYQVLKQIPFDGTNGTPITNAGPGPTGIEQPVWNPKNDMFYIAVPQDGDVASVGAVAVVNPTTFAVTKFVVNNCSPNGNALGPDDQELFLGCSMTAGVQVVPTAGGNPIATIPQANSAGGCDEVWFNSGDNHYLGACNFPGATSQIAVIDAGTGLDGTKVTFDTGLPTNPTGAAGTAPHSVAAYSGNNDIFVPLAKGNSLCSGLNGCIVIYAPTSKSE